MDVYEHSDMRDPGYRAAVAAMNEADLRAYIERLGRAVIDMGKELGTLRQQQRGAVEAVDALLVSLDALNIEAEAGDMAEYDEAREAVERWLTTNRGQ